MANLFIRFFPVDFLLAVVIFYWLSNFVGLFMMYASGRDVLRGGKGIVKKVFNLIITTTVYSLIITALVRMGILKPF